MKRYLLIAILACLTLSANARKFDKGERLYINMEAQSVKDAGNELKNGWYSTTNNYNYAYFFKGGNGAWSTQVKQYVGTVWYVEAPDGDWDNVILTRHNSANANWDTKITQTGNISFYYKDGSETKMRDQNYIQNFYYGDNKDQANWEYVAPAPSGNPATWTLSCEDEQICTSAAGGKYVLQAKNYDYDNTYAHAWFKYASGTWTRIQGAEWRNNEGDKTCEVTLGGVNSDTYYFLQCSRPSMCRLLRIRINQNCEEGAPGACKITSFVAVAAEANVTDMTSTVNGVVAFDDKKNAGDLQIWCPNVDTFTVKNKDIQTPQTFTLKGLDASTTKTYTLYAKFLSGSNCDATCKVTVTPPSATPVTHETTGTEEDLRLIRFTEEDVTLTPDNKDSKYFRWTNTYDDDTISGQSPEERVHTFTAPTEEAQIDYYFLGTNEPAKAEGNLISNGLFEKELGLDNIESTYDYWGVDLTNYYDTYAGASGGYAIVQNAQTFYHTYNAVTAHEGKYFGLFDSKIYDGTDQAAWIARSGEKNPKLKVRAGVSYLFSFWVANINSYDQMNNGAELQFQISYNGGASWTDLGGKINLGDYKDHRWHGLSDVVTPFVSSDNVVLRVINKHISYVNIGNDFALDDIRFEAITANSSNIAAFEKFPVVFHKCVINDATFEQRQPNGCGTKVADVDYTVNFIYPRGDLYIYEGEKLLAQIPHEQIGDNATSYTGVLKNQPVDNKKHTLTVYFDDGNVKTDAPKTYTYNAKAVPAINIKSLTWTLPQPCDVTAATLTAVIEYTNQNGELSANVDGKPANPADYEKEKNKKDSVKLVIPNILADGKTGHILNVTFNGSHGCSIENYEIPTEAPYMPTVSGLSATIQPFHCGDASYDVIVSAAFTNSQSHDIIFKDWLNGTEQHVPVDENEGTATFTFTGYEWETAQTAHTYQVYFVGAEACAENHTVSYNSPKQPDCDTVIICKDQSYPWHGIDRTGPVGENKFGYQHPNDVGVDSLWLIVKEIPSLTIGEGEMTCDKANEIRLPITKKTGDPDLFDITVNGKPFVGTIENGELVFDLTDLEAGEYTGTVVVQETDVPCGSNAAFHFTIAISDQMYTKWTDVIFINNKGDKYKAYQWYKDGVEMKDEVLQRLYDPKGLQSDGAVYHCRLTTQDNRTLYTCPLTFDEITPSREATPVKPTVQQTSVYDTMGRSLNGTLRNGIYIVMEQLEDGTTRVRKVAVWE